MGQCLTKALAFNECLYFTVRKDIRALQAYYIKWKTKKYFECLKREEDSLISKSPLPESVSVLKCIKKIFLSKHVIWYQKEQ